LQRNKAQLFDLRTPWFYTFCIMGRLSFIIVGMWISAALASFRYHHAARRVYASIIFIGNGLCNGLPLFIGNMFYYNGNISLQHTATYCYALQHTATAAHCNTR